MYLIENLQIKACTVLEVSEYVAQNQQNVCSKCQTLVKKNMHLSIGNHLEVLGVIKNTDMSILPISKSQAGLSLLQSFFDHRLLSVRGIQCALTKLYLFTNGEILK